MYTDATVYNRFTQVKNSNSINKVNFTAVKGCFHESGYPENLISIPLKMYPEQLSEAATADVL